MLKLIEEEKEMTTYGLKVANTEENRSILNRVDTWWVNHEDT